MQTLSYALFESGQIDDAIAITESLLNVATLSEVCTLHACACSVTVWVWVCVRTSTVRCKVISVSGGSPRRAMLQRRRNTTTTRTTSRLMQPHVRWGVRDDG
jgi:hypothetical protein